MSPDQFEQFFRRYKNNLYVYLLRFVEIDDDAQDLLQDSCIAFYKKLDEIKPETAINYMYKIAHNTALNWTKQRRRFLLKPSSDFERIADKPAPKDHYEAVNKAIAMLPSKLARVVHMYYYDKLSYKEISSQTGKSIKAIDSMLNRARTKLRKRIIMHEDGSPMLKT